MSHPKVSVIIPVYKVERFIERCARSLFAQTLFDVEFIFVDDASPDSSISVLESVISEKSEVRCKILRHEVNKGLPAARNTGLQAATGEYIFHCDSDDFVEPSMLSDLYEEAIKSNADAVWCDWLLSFDKSERYMSQPSFDNPEDAVRAMLDGRMKFNVWNKLVRRSLYSGNHILFPDGYGMGEDMTMIMCFAKAKTISYLPRAYYHYVQTNSSAFSKTYSAKHLDELKYNIAKVTSFIHQYYGDSMERELSIMKLEAKYPFLLARDQSRVKLWREWYPESNDYINDSSFSFHRRIPQWLAKNNMFWMVRIYSIIYHMLFKLLFK